MKDAEVSAGVITVAEESARTPEATAMIAALSAELGALYGDDGTAYFTPEDVEQPGGLFVVARIGGAPVGCGALRPWEHAPEGERVGEVKRMYVAPGLRGRGVGRSILALIEERAATLGYTRLTLETGWKQPDAMALYDRAGWRQCPCIGRYADDPESVCYEKGLPRP